MPKHLSLLLTIAALTATAVVVTPAAGQEAPAVLADDTLREAVAALEEGREAGSEVELVDGRARVEILHHSDTATITALVETAGGEVYGDVPGELVEGLVPWEALAGLEAADAIDFIRTPESVNQPIESIEDAATEAGFISQEVRKTRADTWHQDGQWGAGIGIGVIDLFDQSTWSAARAEGEVHPSSGTFCRVYGSTDCTVWDADEPHGVAVVEVLDDMAPEADVYLAYVETASDFQAAIDWFATKGVDVVTRSLTSPFDGPGDGTGPVATVIDNAVAGGMTFVQAAGNNAGRSTAPAVAGSYLRWTFADVDADGWVEFAPGDERLTVDCGYLNGLRWNDFAEGADATDYDLYVYNGNGLVQQDVSQDAQQAGAPPIERTDDCTTARNQIAVQLVDVGAAAEGDVLELMMNGVGFEHWTNPGSASGPAADTANPGALTVGAIDPAAGTTAGYYSSQGPTTDGRTKPDLVAASCVGSFVFTPQCFAGTSVSAPVVAGAAALYLGSEPAATPAEVATWLKTTARVDRGVSGPDNIYGEGEMILPSMGPRPRYRADISISVIRPDGAVGQGVGIGIYSTNGIGQTVTNSGAAYTTVRFRVRVFNRGTVPDRMFLIGSRSALGFRTVYGDPVISRQVMNGGFYTPVIDPDRYWSMTIRVFVPRSVPRGSGVRGALSAYANGTFDREDLVRFITIRWS